MRYTGWPYGEYNFDAKNVPSLDKLRPLNKPLYKN